MGFKELQHPCPRAGLFSQAHVCQGKSWAGSPPAKPAASPGCPLRPAWPRSSPSSQPCCVCPSKGAQEEQKAGVSPRHKETKQAPCWAEMDHFASVERPAHASVPGSLWLASHRHLLPVSRVPLSKSSSSFPDKCFLEPREGLIFSTLLRDATENDLCPAPEGGGE